MTFPTQSFSESSFIQVREASTQQILASFLNHILFVKVILGHFNLENDLLKPIYFRKSNRRVEGCVDGSESTDDKVGLLTSAIMEEEFEEPI